MGPVIRHVGSRVKRNIGRKTYLYYVYYDHAVRKEKYCGDTAKPEALRRAIRYEIDDLTRRKKAMAEKIAELKRQLREGE